ncbi:hypothetical protein SC1_03568 [Sphingopyxis sp. C-1]|nr:hypothetical protein SC1_03568 [Sphingopyxis sp. C-1]
MRAKSASGTRSQFRNIRCKPRTTARALSFNVTDAHAFDYFWTRVAPAPAKLGNRLVVSP